MINLSKKYLFIVALIIGFVYIAQAQTPPIVEDISPRSAYQGQEVVIVGTDLGPTINLNAADGTVYHVSAILNSDSTIAAFDVPSDIPNGIYSVDVINEFGIGSATINFTKTDPPLTSIRYDCSSDNQCVRNPEGRFTSAFCNGFCGDTSGPPSTGGGDIEERPPLPPPSPFSAPPPLPAIPTAGLPTGNLAEDIQLVLQWSMRIIGLVVLVMIIWGGLLWLFAAGNPSTIAAGRHKMLNAVMGAILLASSYLILNTINPDLVRGTFYLTGIGGSNTNSQSAGPTSAYLVGFTDEEIASAVTAGCSVNFELIREFAALECDEDIASTLSLPTDSEYLVSDTAANDQVGATSAVISSANSGQNVKVMIIDTGYNRSHPELISSYLGGWDFYNNDPDPSDEPITDLAYQYTEGHGSHVAGIITADGITGQARGIAPSAGILAAKVTGGPKNSTRFSIIADAIYWAVNGPDGDYGTADDPHPDIINMSLGSRTTFYDHCDSDDPNLTKAVNYAANHGILMVAAAGNYGSGITSPGCLSNVLTVGSVARNNILMAGSGTGTKLDVVAPGVNILGPVLGVSYDTKSGTSQAAPVVSGLAALIKSAHPNYTAEEIKRAIISTAIDLDSPGKDSRFGYGLVSASAINGSVTPPPCSGSGGCGTLRVDLPSCTKGTIAGNPSCRVTFTYTSQNVSELSLRKDGLHLQNLVNSSGSLYDGNPTTGTHTYILFDRLRNSALASVTVNIYARGTLSANFSTCTQGGAGGNCDVTLTYALGGSTNALIKKDGLSWRTVLASGAITDSSPNPGIHTYTLHDATTGTRLARATVTIIAGTGGGSTPNPSFVELCSETNFGGTCQTFYTHNISNLTNTTLGNDNVSSIRVGFTSIWICRDINSYNVCELFRRGDYPNLNGHLIRDNEASSTWGGPGWYIIACADQNFGGTCERFNANDPDLRDNAVGDNQISSIYMDSTGAIDARFCADINYGTCTNFGPGFYPNLSASSLENIISSIGSI